MERQTDRRQNIAPRLLRFRDAPRYLGMDRNRFNAEVRPLVTEIRIGRQAWPLTVLNLTTGSTTLNPATDGPVDSKEQ